MRHCKRLYFGAVLLAAIFISSSNAGETRVCSDRGVLIANSCLCFEGFGGDDCATQCSGRGVLSDSTGICNCTSPFFSGPNCEIECSGNGVVSTTNTCACVGAHVGKFCEIPCNGHGRLTASGECSCDTGWGTQELGCKIACSGHGHVNSQGECQCEGAWGGIECDVECSNHGTFQDLSAGCLCDRGFSGPACDVECSGYGKVTKVANSNKTKCECFDEFHSGVLCELECWGNGVISNGACECFDASIADEHCLVESKVCGAGQLVNQSYCLCPPNTAGDYCQFEVNNNTDICVHGRINDQGICVCDSAYGGSRCQLLCSGRGFYNDTLELCECFNGWGGESCTRSCSGHGTLVNNKCSCEFPYTGTYCDVTCSGNGIFVNETCKCQSHFAGLVCERPCSGNGALVETPGGTLECGCDTGYSGENCEIRCNGFPFNDTTCLCPQILGPSCDSLCSGRGFVVTSVLGEGETQKFILPRLPMSIMTQLHQRVQPDDTAKETVTWILKLASPPQFHQPAAWIVSEAYCACALSAFQGEGCATTCGGHGLLAPAYASRYMEAVSSWIDRCEDGEIDMEECVATTQRSSGTPALCECEADYGSLYGDVCSLCSGRGALVGGVCSCTYGYVGSACDQPCHGHGFLDEKNNCVCFPHIQGNTCEKACDWMCKGGSCHGETCSCDEGFSGEWCTQVCDGEVCEEILDPNDPPLRWGRKRSGGYIAVVVLTYFFGFLLLVILGFLMRAYLCIELPERLKRKTAKNRSRYMNQRSAADEPAAQDPVYESYDNPDFVFSADRQLDENRAPEITKTHVHGSPQQNKRLSISRNNDTRQRVNDDDELEVDLHGDDFRSS